MNASATNQQTNRVPSFDDLCSQKEFIGARALTSFGFWNTDVAKSQGSAQISREELKALSEYQRQTSSRQGLNACGVARRHRGSAVNIRKITYAAGRPFAYMEGEQICNSWFCVRDAHRNTHTKQGQLEVLFQAAVDAGYELDFFTLTMGNTPTHTPAFYSREKAFLSSPEYLLHAGYPSKDIYPREEAFNDWLEANPDTRSNSWDGWEYVAKQDALINATSKLFTGSWSDANKKKHGLIGWVHVSEDLFTPTMKDGVRDFGTTTIHTHKHLVAFRERSDAAGRKAFHDRVINRFITEARKEGFAASPKAQDAQWVQTSDKGTAARLSHYLVKQLNDFGLTRDGENEELDIEGDGSKSFTHWGVLKEAFNGNPSALTLWHNLENARKFKSPVVVTPSLGKRLGLDVESLTPKRREPVSNDIIATLPPASLFKLGDKPQAGSLLLNAVENTAEGEGALQVLNAWGLDYLSPTKEPKAA